MTMEKVGRAMSWSLVARVAAFAVGLSANIIIIHALSTRDYGLYSEIRTILQFVLVTVMLGVDAATLKFGPILRMNGGGDAFARTFRRLVLLQVLVWLCVLVLSRFGGSLFSVFFRDPSGRFGFYLEIAVVCFIGSDPSDSRSPPWLQGLGQLVYRQKRRCPSLLAALFGSHVRAGRRPRDDRCQVRSGDAR